MKAIICTLLVLMTVFGSAWAYKINNPVGELDHFAYGVDPAAGAWWVRSSAEPIIVASESWRLDPEIPENYIPVLGHDELYMIIDESGNIIGYRQRVRQADGSWLWHDVNPDIPDEWEAVEGLDNVYRVVGPDGTARYYRYHRNADGTFWFEEVDSNGNPLQAIFPNDGTIPDNFVHVGNNIYAVYNEHGVIIGYVERIRNEDGTYSWREVDEPPDMQYRQGTSMDDQRAGQEQDNQDGQGSWLDGFLTILGGGGSGGGSGGGVAQVHINDHGSQTSTQQHSDGTYTEIETFTEQRLQGGYTIIMETTITKVYNSDGSLRSTRRDGPNEISRFADAPGAGGHARPNPALIASTLSLESARVMDGFRSNTSIANDLLALLNAARIAENLAPLSMASGDLMHVAQIKAADMGIYNHTDFSSPMYGTVEQLMGRFGVHSLLPSEHLWRTSSRGADQIHERFQTLPGTRQTRMSDLYTQVAIVVLEKDGWLLIAEIFND